MRCQGCGREVKSDFKYCPYCAQRLVQDLHNQFEALDPLPLLAEDPPLETEDPAAAFYLSAAYGADGDDELVEGEEGDMESVYEEELIIDLEAPPSMDLDIEPMSPKKRSTMTQKENFPKKEPKDPPPAYYVYQPEDSVPAPIKKAPPVVAEAGEPLPQRRAPIEEPPPIIDDGEEEDDVPYVSMQPEITRREEPVRKDTTPGIGIKIVLIVGILLLGFLVSFVGYRFFSTPDPLHNFQFSSLFLSLVPSFIL